MNLSLRQRPVVFGLAGAIALAAGATAAVSAHASTPGTPATTATTATTQTQSAPQVGTSPTTDTPATTTPTTPPSAATTVGPVTLPQAVALATAQTHARLDKVEAKTGPAGVDYDVKLVRADGTEVEVFVVGRTGQVLSEAQQEAREASQPEQPDQPDNPDVHDAADPVAD